jgi:hypothetical protein
MKTKQQQSPATGRHVTAQGAAANNRKPRIANIDVMRSTPNGRETIAKYSCEYYSTVELLWYIFNYFCTGEHFAELPDDLRITLPSGFRFFWNFNLAHYCFAHGRLDVKTFFYAMTGRRTAV